MLWLLWWLLIGAASVQAGRAWGAPAALGVSVVLSLISFLPWGLGTVLSLVGAIAIGVRAENEITPTLTFRG